MLGGGDDTQKSDKTSIFVCDASQMPRIKQSHSCGYASPQGRDLDDCVYMKECIEWPIFYKYNLLRKHSHTTDPPIGIPLMQFEPPDIDTESSIKFYSKAT